MARIIEPLIQETCRSELESRGFSVYGEVPLPDSGRIDLYVVTPNGRRWGIGSVAFPLCLPTIVWFV